ncbi:MAG: acetyl-CoA carboxylase carboxyltransferase subunit beta [Proteobacteria bacterium]|nr:acetyl-CoA carboxylase carboxyltransferase subunit beta [Pseudomonadota bacterium]
MNWLSNFARPGLKKQGAEEPKRDTPDNLWIKDPISGDLIYRSELEALHWVTPSGFHMRIGPEPRFRQLFDDQAWQKITLPKVETDPLKFKDDKKYVDRLKSARNKVRRDDTMEAGYGRVGGLPTVILVQDFEFMGGSLGMAAGDAFIAAAEAAVRRNAAMVMITASGGARMQEGILSLMQLPRTTLAVQMLKEEGLPYIVILADPTTGGVTASYAMLGDIHIAEPGALIGFAGPRVIEQTIRQKLPEGFQRSEYLHDKGMVDMVVDRRQLKATLSTLLSVLMSKRAANAGADAETIEMFEGAEEEPVSKRKPTKAPRAKAAE